MKAGVLAVAAAIAGGVNARDLGRRHGHQDFHERGLLATAASSSESCGCTTVWSTVTGEPQLYFPPAPTAASVASSSVVSPAPSSATSAEGLSSVPAASAPGSSAPAPSAPAASAPGSSAPATSKGVSTAPTAPASTAPAVVPTPLATTCPTPGVYTIPATTVTLTESTTVCGATSTGLPSAGTYTVGGVTTVVTTATTVVCPYAAVSTSEGVVTSTILTTTYVCPSAGTYTINPLTTTVTEPAVWVYPTPASYAPGTYTQPEVVTTITETNVVVFCPYSSSYSTIVDATLPVGTPAQATSAPAPVTTSVVVPVATPSSSSVYVAPSSSAVYVAPSSSAASLVPSSSAVASSVVASSVASPSASSTSSSSAGNGGSVGSTGKQWAMTYSPYQDSGSCKTAAEVSVDVALIASKGFTAIRIYSTDCSGLENVGNAAKLAGLKLIVGIFISETGCSGAADQVTDLIAWGQWSLVELIVVGNEAVFGGHTTASELAAFISSSRSSFASAGYTGQITTTEPLNIWQENTSVLCSAVDITGANLHPFFNAEVTAENAGKFALSQLELADAICPGLTAINLETGWPSAGTCNGAACPGADEQKTAVASIIESCGGRAAIFSYTNDLWKQPGGFGCEQSWGSIHLF
ncbi:putative cell wall glucanase protein [Botrytis fragariae]|uniref:Probable beta-glucosidase btgE n=1 Tax=Botrytis fragariae TaxID=1964551 RepID=A0A8H6B3R8_9HELO|nr:putative cell wall glucanase protein [Botrytis fragariae]KAF5878635.1 putative cell wall glucanase protein [Botrytis fragariae]